MTEENFLKSAELLEALEATPEDPPVKDVEL